jgi:hypothetical protein
MQINNYSAYPQQNRPLAQDPKADDLGTSYNLQAKIAQENAENGTNISFAKERAAEGAKLVLNLIV